MWIWILGGLAAVWLVSRSSSASTGPRDSGGGASPRSNGPECADLGILPPPTPGKGTGFDALSDEPLIDLPGATLRTLYEAPMKLTPQNIATFTSAELYNPAVESGAMGAENFAALLRCNGYIKAADQLTAKAAEIRSWKKKEG